MTRHRAMLLSIACIAAFLHLRFIYQDVDLVTHEQTINGIAADPYNYRVLFPSLVHAGAMLTPSSYAETAKTLYMAFGAVTLFAWVFGVYALYRRFASEGAALIGAALCALAYAIFGQIPTSMAYMPLEAVFIAWSSAWIADWYASSSLASLPASTVRLAYSSVRWRLWRVPFLLLSIGVFIVITIRITQGEAARYWTIDRVFNRNMEMWLEGLLNIIPLMPVLYLSAFNFRRAPLIVKGFAIAGLCYLVPIMIFGIWNETRLLMPVYPLLIAPLITQMDQRALLTRSQ